MNTFVHIGDLHLQSSHPLNADRLRAFDRIIDENIARQDLAAWLLPGDIFHARSSAIDRNDVALRLQSMAAVGPVVLAYGNHEVAQDLDIFGKLKAEWPIYVLHRPLVLTVPLATGHTAAIWILPYPHRSGLVAAGVPSDQIVNSARQALEVIVMQAAAELDAADAEGRITLAIGHVNVGGSLMCAGQPNIGTEIELDPSLIARLNGRYVGLNHIHLPQEIGGAWYAGSCARLDWGERGIKRYLTITYADTRAVDSDDMHHWDYIVESHPIDVPEMIHVEGELTRDGFSWHVKDGETPASFVGMDVRVRYRFGFDEKTALDETLVRTPFEGARRLELDPIAVRNRASRAPEVAAATTLDEKVAAFATRSGLSWAGSLDAKMSALQNPDGAAFLSSVYNGLSGADAEDCSVVTDSSVTSAETGSHATVSAEPAPGNQLSGALL